MNLIDNSPQTSSPQNDGPGVVAAADITARQRAPRMRVVLMTLVAAVALMTLTTPTVAGAQSDYPAPPVSCFGTNAAGTAQTSHGYVKCTVNVTPDAGSLVTITVGGTVYTFNAHDGFATYGPVFNGPNPTTSAVVSVTVNGITHTLTRPIIVVDPPPPTATPTPLPYVTPLPTTVPTTHPTAVPTATPTPHPPLAVTGANSGFVAAMGGVLLVLGVLFMLTTRRMGGLTVESQPSSASGDGATSSFLHAIED